MKDQFRRINGYVLIHMPDHPRALSGGESGYVYEHIVVAEKTIKRHLTNKECVHHLDLNRANNSPDNLIVVSEKAHQRIHGWLRRGAPIAGTKHALKDEVKDIVKGTKRYAKLKNRCKQCGKQAKRKQQFCSAPCYKVSIRKSDISKKKLQKLVDARTPWVQIGKILGVSDNGARCIARRLGVTF